MAAHAPVQGEVVLLTLGDRRRPAIVVSSNWFNSQRDECVVVAVTAHAPAPSERDYLPLADAEATHAGLPGAAVVLTGKLLTAPRARIAKSLGRLSDTALHALLERLSEVLGLL